MPRRLSARFGLFVFAAALTVAAQSTAGQQTAGNGTADRPAGGILGRPSPPQPVQKPGVEYFIGSWTFTWTGRESALTPGPRSGTVSFTRRGDTQFLDFQTAGTVEGASAYKESGSLEWRAEKKTMMMLERLAGNLEVSSAGDWSSPISIRFVSDPIKVKDQTLKLRRTYGIVSATSFTVAEELSTDGGPFVRLGGGVFSKAVK